MKGRLYATALALLVVALLLIGCGGGAATPSEVTDADLRLPESTTVVPTRARQGKVAKADAAVSTPPASAAEQTTTPDATGLEPGDVAVTTSPSASNADAIHWFEWDPDTFALAEAEDKLILLDLTAVWCHWCHVMDETTYSDPDVIRTINELYIPVRVDTDQRPDVTARYLANGWPTTAFLTPAGDILAAYTYVPPEEMLSIMPQIDEYYAANEVEIAARVAELRQEREAARLQAVSGLPSDPIALALGRLEADYDPTFGGFGREPKFPAPAAVALIFRYTHSADDATWQERATRTLDGVRNLIDPVWGGAYRYSVTGDWLTPHFEKMLFGNAEVLGNFLEAYQVTDDVAYRTAAEAILRYLERFLWDPGGGFYGSQDADLVQPGGHEILMDGEEYFLLAEEERLALGVPYVDETFYANWNGQMVVAMLDAASALNEPRYQEMALLTLDRLWKEARGPEGQIWHSLRRSGNDTNERIALPPATLSDQTHFGLALLSAYSATGQRSYLTAAEGLAGYVLSELRGPESGGFFDLSDDPAAAGERETPCQDNVVAARFFARVYRITEREDYREAAESALRVCGAVMVDTPEFALAADDLLRYPLTLAVVGAPGESATAELLTAANQFYTPGKVVIPLDPALGPPAVGSFTYPKDRTAIYACIEERCTLPIEDPRELADAVTWLLSAEEQ